MGIYKNFKIDKDLEEQGYWHEVGVNENGHPIQFLLARMSQDNTPYDRELTKRMKPYNKSLLNGTLDNKVINKINVDLFVKYILLDWCGVLDENEEEIAFTKENAQQLMEDLPVLFRELMAEARDNTNFLASSREEDLGNS